MRPRMYYIGIINDAHGFLAVDFLIIDRIRNSCFKSCRINAKVQERLRINTSKEIWCFTVDSLSVGIHVEKLIILGCHNCNVAVSIHVCPVSIFINVSCVSAVKKNSRNDLLVSSIIRCYSCVAGLTSH